MIEARRLQGEITLEQMLTAFTRDELRKFASHHKIERGRNKEDTIRNICKSYKQGITIIIDTEA